MAGGLAAASGHFVHGCAVIVSSMETGMTLDRRNGPQPICQPEVRKRGRVTGYGTVPNESGGEIGAAVASVSNHQPGTLPGNIGGCPGWPGNGRLPAGRCGPTMRRLA